MSSCTRTIDGTFSPGRRLSCQIDSGRAPCASQLGAFGPPSPRRAIDGQEGRRREGCSAGDGAVRVTRTRFPRLLALLGAFWPVPSAAVAFLVAITTMGYTSWGQALPGVQAILIMSLLQCCWAVMSPREPRRLMRLTQLTAALLGVITLLPRRDLYGMRIWASAFDDEGGVILPGFAASLAALFGLLGAGSTGAGGANGVGWAGYLGDSENTDFHRALLCLEGSLAAVVVLWLLQAAAASYQARAAAAAAAASLSIHSALKSHPDLPALEALEDVAPLCDPRLGIRPDAAASVLLDSGLDPGAHPCAAAFGHPGQRSPRHPAESAAGTELHQHQQLGRSQPVTAAAAASCCCCCGGGGGQQRALLIGACAAQCVAATILVATWDTFAQRLRLQEGAQSITSAQAPTQPTRLPSFATAPDDMRASWLTLALLAGAMSATLALPALLRSCHPALLAARPIPSHRSLGLLLLDANAAKLLLAVSVGALGGWRAGALTWQLLQVCTMVFGLAKLYAGGLMALLQSGAVAAAPPGGGGLGTAVALPARLTLVVPAGQGCWDDAGGAPVGLVSDCVSAALRAAVVSPRFVDAVLVGRGTSAALHERGAAVRTAAAFGPEAASPAALAPASCADEATATIASTGSSGGGSHSGCSQGLRSPCVSGNSLASAGDVGQHQAGQAAAGGGGDGGGGGGAPCPSAWMTTSMAQLARRPPPLCVAGHASHCPTSHHNSFSHHHNHHNHHLRSPLLVGNTSSARAPPLGVGSSSPRLPLPACGPRSAAGGAAACCVRRCGLAAAAALQPWSLLLASLSLLGGMLWLVLMAPPLALLGDEPADIFEALVDTGPGAAAVLTLLVGVASASTVSGACLLWCIANGQLRQKWRLNPVEGRRLECLAWACGPPLAAAAFSALSWALGEERNAVAFAAAEALRCGSLWPLVWLQEPWLLGGFECVGGCSQHAGCGVTCCVLRWLGLRPSGAGSLGGRCDAGSGLRGATGQPLARIAARRGRGGSVQVEVN